MDIEQFGIKPLILQLDVYLSGGGLPLVEVTVVGGAWRVKAWLEEHTAQSYGLHGSWTLVGEAQTHKHLGGKGWLRITVMIKILLEQKAVKGTFSLVTTD